MRTKDILIEGFENIKILQQYLYMSEEHTILIHNCIGVPLRLRMDDNGIYMCQNMNFPNVPETCWAEDMTINMTLDVIEVLKEEPAVEFPQRFENRWEEIKMLTQANLSLNII